ncbi:dihydrodipicolinate synthase family protein [Solirhodobacter olei]|uniref:dihydrodipicolinate synthase family protein n=1 Tax=Solirhodobacter olei TaxID=2493082 RepID=UPI000FDA0111|nr:dihydrodipicolinate synthase family protein [Solirhodobacter olei]
MTRLQGIVCPIATPFNADGSLARDLYAEHAKRMLEQGAHYLSPFGTTGEALSLGVRERREALEGLVADGVPAERLMPGTGVPSLTETRELSAHAVELGCAAVMVLPSFFYGAVGDAGQARFFGELIEGLADPRLRVLLYNIPQNSGVAVTPALAARLNAAYPETVVAYKDSSGDWENTRSVISAVPGISVFPGSESFLSKGLAAGGGGCISATVNLNAAAIRAVYDGTRAGRDVTEAEDRMKAVRLAAQAAGLIGGIKAVLAVRTGDRRWLNLRAPHLDVSWELGEALEARIAAIEEGAEAAG